MCTNLNYFIFSLCCKISTSLKLKLKILIWQYVVIYICTNRPVQNKHKYMLKLIGYNCLFFFSPSYGKKKSIEEIRSSQGQKQNWNK